MPEAFTISSSQDELSGNIVLAIRDEIYTPRDIKSILRELEAPVTVAGASGSRVFVLLELPESLELVVLPERTRGQ